MSNVSMIDGHIDEVKQTNYDRIKNMSVEEMAENLMGGNTFCPYKVFTTIKFCPNSNCDECIKNWLKSEATE